MALTQLNTYANDDTDILAMQTTEDATFIGKHQVALTEINTTTVPAIAAGSIIEVNGALLRADTEQAINTTDPVTSATVADGVVYVMIDGTTMAPYFTATAPTWSDSKQGWYGTSTYANWRYFNFQCTKATAAYTEKTYTEGFNKTFIKPCFSAYMPNGGQTLGTGTVDIVEFRGKYFDIGGGFNTSTYTYTAPVTGKYYFSAFVDNTVYGGAEHTTRLHIYINDSEFKRVYFTKLTSGASLSIHSFADCAVGDTVNIRIYCSVASGYAANTTPYTDSKYLAQFDGFLVL